MIKYICGKCNRETSPPRGFPFIECPHCGCITSANEARVEVPDLKIPPRSKTMNRLELKDKMGDHFVAEYLPEPKLVSIEVESDGDFADSLIDVKAMQELRDWLDSAITEALKP